MRTLIVTVSSDSSQTLARKNREVVFERSSVYLHTGGEIICQDCQLEISQIFVKVGEVN